MKSSIRDITSADLIINLSFYLAIIVSIPLVYFYPWTYPISLLGILILGYSMHLKSQSRSTFLSRILKNAPLIVHVNDTKTSETIFANDEMIHTLGYTMEEAQTLKANIYQNLVHPDDWKKIIDAREVLSKSNDGISAQIEYRIRRKDGSYAHFRSRSTVFTRNHNGEIEQTLNLTEDISEQVALQLHLELEKVRAINNEKFASLGQIAGGISHEINNPLAIILGNAQAVRMRLEKGQFDIEELIRQISKIETTTKRISKIVGSLKAISRDDYSDKPLDTSVSLLLEDSKAFWSQKLVDHNVHFEIEPFSSQLSIHCRPLQIIIVILNIVGNAFQAIKDSPEKWVKIRVVELESSVEIQIIDSGKGIPEPIRSKIFEPFFTTKSVDEGTGLGLSISRGIMKANKGSIAIDSNCPNTCFVISLPRGNSAKIAA